ncbi:glycoside hydrolase family 88/105 protein [Pseudochryseolinea flava]|uniref:Glycosyl hydrolase family 88 n=1 Tax=Pseudochryseolinea flava TaxID=2059302 RepID=A0A364Y188_9BACT|nr:glycoside hydrolase family 88 protein [Pseudochryseolinea flava]RAW00043.1 glycosyl hydrolase family 88 [Pseudochryseolinea flava]
MKVVKYLFYSALMIVLSCCSTLGNGHDKILVTVERVARPLNSKEAVDIVFPWDELVKRFPAAKSKSIEIFDRNFGQKVDTRLVDSDKNGTPEAVVIHYTFASTDPVYTFSVHQSKNQLEVENKSIAPNANLKVSFLKSSEQFTKEGLKWSDKIVQSSMTFYPDPLGIAIYSPGEWNYEYGYFLSGVFELGKQTGNSQYIQYAKQWADHFIDANGNMDTTEYDRAQYRLDDVQPARLFVYLYGETKEEKYKHAADQFIDHMKNQPTTKEGGYWHKQIYPYQMWLDGIFMGDVFSMQYAKQFNEKHWIDEAIHQIKLMSKYTLDPKTGLMYHGWDESKNKTWAHQEKGTSPEFWGRAVGWYMMALAEAMECIPKDHPERKDVEKIFRDLSASVLKYQDKNSKLWFQVLDKGNQPGNWIETSCAAMFGYAMAKGANLGALDKSYLTVAQGVFKSLTQDYVYFDDAGRLYLDMTVKVGTLNPKFSKGDYAYYIATERRINDYKGLASLLFLAKELEYKR